MRGEGEVTIIAGNLLAAVASKILLGVGRVGARNFRLGASALEGKFAARTTLFSAC